MPSNIDGFLLTDLAESGNNFVCNGSLLSSDDRTSNAVFREYVRGAATED